jgi:hypothetical protein
MRSLIRLYVFNESDEELAGQDAPARLKELAAQAALSNKVEFALSSAQPLIARPLIMHNGVRYVIARQYPRGLLSILYEESRTMAPKLFVAFLLVGILCYWLARHLTAPIVKLHGGSVTLANSPKGGLLVEITVPV